MDPYLASKYRWIHPRKKKCFQKMHGRQQDNQFQSQHTLKRCLKRKQVSINNALAHQTKDLHSLREVAEMQITIFLSCILKVDVSINMVIPCISRRWMFQIEASNVYYKEKVL